MPNDNVLTDEQILDVFRDAGLDLNATTNMLYAVRGQHAQLLKAARALLSHPGQPKPIDMLLFCPKCGEQHIDAPEPADADVDVDGTVISATPEWENPPHRSHLCANCKTVWRPADVPTNGVAAIATHGKADTWDGKPEPRAEVTGCAHGVDDGACKQCYHDATDTARLDWVMHRLSGKALRDIGVVYSEGSPVATRAAIDAARTGASS